MLCIAPLIHLFKLYKNLKFYWIRLKLRLSQINSFYNKNPALVTMLHIPAFSLLWTATSVKMNNNRGTGWDLKISTSIDHIELKFPQIWSLTDTMLCQFYGLLFLASRLRLIDLENYDSDQKKNGLTLSCRDMDLSKSEITFCNLFSIKIEVNVFLPKTHTYYSTWFIFWIAINVASFFLFSVHGCGFN